MRPPKAFRVMDKDFANLSTAVVTDEEVSSTDHSESSAAACEVLMGSAAEPESDRGGAG